MNTDDIPDADCASFLDKLITKLQNYYAEVRHSDLTLAQIGQRVKEEHTALSRARYARNRVRPQTARRYIARIIQSYQLEIYNLRYRPLDFRITTQANPPISVPNSRHVHYYLYHYIPKNAGAGSKIARAKLMIDSGNRTAELTFYKRQDFTDKITSVTEPAFVQNNIVLQFPLKRNRHDTVTQIPSTVFLQGNEAALSHEILIGTFTALGPSSGICVALRMDREEVHRVLQTPTEAVEPIVRYVLRRSRLQPLDDTPQVIDETRAAKLRKRLSHHIGKYEGYVLESRESRESIHVLRFEIFDNFRIRYQDVRSGSEEYTEGLIVDLTNNCLVCKFNYQSHKGLFRNRMIFHMQSPDQRLDMNEDEADLVSNCYIGVYAGIESDNLPIAGRILLYRPEEQESLHPIVEVRLKKHKEIDAIFQARPFLKRFLLGYLDNFVDRPELLDRFEIKVQSKAELRRIDPLVGTYLSIRLYNDGKRIHIRPLKIYPTGTVRMFNRFSVKNQHRGGVYNGKAIVFDRNILSMYFSDRDGTPFYFHMLFRFDTYNDDEHWYSFGAETIYSGVDKIRAGRQLLVRVNERDIEMEGKLYAERVPLSEASKHPRIQYLQNIFPGLLAYFTRERENYLFINRQIP